MKRIHPIHIMSNVLRSGPRALDLAIKRARWSFAPVPHIAGLTRVRNESAIIADTLDHYARLCDAGLYVYDDCSTDSTATICREHSAVIDVVRGDTWNPNRLVAEHATRQAVLERALQDRPQWLMYFDADERVELDLESVPWRHCDAVSMKLFDFYITEEDVAAPYYERKWIGPEYRQILMIFRNMPGVGYGSPDQRESYLPSRARVIEAGYVRHYGKAISVEEWEATCRYYADNFPEPYRSKWLTRMGRALHTQSDFGRPLIRWEERDEHGIPLAEQ